MAGKMSHLHNRGCRQYRRHRWRQHRRSQGFRRSRRRLCHSFLLLPSFSSSPLDNFRAKLAQPRKAGFFQPEAAAKPASKAKKTK
jgi:hypothetical protein